MECMAQNTVGTKKEKIHISILCKFSYLKCILSYVTCKPNVRFLQDKTLNKNNFSIPESYNMNISHQLVHYKIAFVNLQHKNTNSKDGFVLKNLYKCSF